MSIKREIGLPFLIIFVYPFLKRRSLTKDYEKIVQATLDKIDVESTATIEEA